MKRRNFLWVAMLSVCALTVQAATPDSARQLVERQALAWEKQDFTLAAWGRIYLFCMRLRGR